MRKAELAARIADLDAEIAAMRERVEQIAQAVEAMQQSRPETIRVYQQEPDTSWLQNLRDFQRSHTLFGSF